MKMINTINWAWPQYVYLILVLIGWLNYAHFHGQVKSFKYDVMSKIIVSLAILLILVSGGFFK